MCVHKQALKINSSRYKNENSNLQQKDNDKQMFLNAPLCVVIYKTNGNFGRDNVDEMWYGIICFIYYDNLVTYNLVKYLNIKRCMVYKDFRSYMSI